MKENERAKRTIGTEDGQIVGYRAVRYGLDTRSAIKREVTCITPVTKKQDEEHIAQCSYQPARRFCLTKVMHTLARYIREVKIDDVYGKRVREGYAYAYT